MWKLTLYVENSFGVGLHTLDIVLLGKVRCDLGKVMKRIWQSYEYNRQRAVFVVV